MKMLICHPSPRDIREVEESNMKLPHDHYWVKYVRYSDKPNPYERFQKFFLDHKEYSHMAIAPDDLVVNDKGVEQLIKDIKTKKMKIVMGICNVNTNNLDLLAVTKNMPKFDPEERAYEFYTRDELKGKTLFKAHWCGTPFAIIERSLVEKLKFTIPHVPQKDNVPFAFDLGIATQCHAMKIPLWVDMRADFYHMRYMGENFCGKKPQDWWYDKDGIRTTDPNAALVNMENKWKIFMENNGFASVPSNEFMEALFTYVKTLKKVNYQ